MIMISKGDAQFEKMCIAFINIVHPCDDVTRDEENQTFLFKFNLPSKKSETSDNPDESITMTYMAFPLCVPI